jgi:hypothetical protein
MKRLVFSVLTALALAGGALTLAAGGASASVAGGPGYNQPGYVQPQFPGYPAQPGYVAPTAFPRLSCTYRDQQVIRVLERYRYLTAQQRAQLRFLLFICGNSGLRPTPFGNGYPVNNGAGYPVLYDGGYQG